MSLDVVLAGQRGSDFTLDVAFVVPAEGVTALLGPSGSGKTSVLRGIAGLDRHVGTVRFAGEIWQDARCFVPPHRRRIGYVAQGVSLLPHLTVAENLTYAARRAPAGPFTRDAIVARTGITALLGRRPDRLSGGEARRASIARALLSQPQVLLMDEPLAGLDAAARDELLAALAVLFAEVTLPVVYVTHDAAEAKRLAAAEVHLRDGRIEWQSVSRADPASHLT